MLIKLIKHQQPDVDKTYSYIKDPFKSKYQLLINGNKKVGIEHLKSAKEITEYSQTIDVYKNLEDYNTAKKITLLIVLDGI